MVDFGAENDYMYNVFEVVFNVHTAQSRKNQFSVVLHLYGIMYVQGSALAVHGVLLVLTTKQFCDVFASVLCINRIDLHKGTYVRI